VHNKYLACEKNGDANMNRDKAFGWEHFQFIFTGEGVKIYSPEHKKYLRSDNQQIRCDTENDGDATEFNGWYVPNPNKRLSEVPKSFITMKTQDGQKDGWGLQAGGDWV